MATKGNKSKVSTNSKSKLRVDTIIHEEATRKNIPTAEYQSIMQNKEKTPIQVAYERRNKDLDPQLVWRGKDQQAWSDLVISAPPLYIQEKVHPKVIIDDLIKRKSKHEDAEQIDLFSDFNGLPSEGAKTEFYQHDAHWTNRMILGDSLQVMASLAEREGLRGKVQCIYFDPPYGIKFNSNFQWSTTSRDVKDGKSEHITREPEQVKAFRDTWRDGIHSYMTYLRDRLEVSRDLLTDSGSIFVQIGEENVHRVRALLDEVFGEENFNSQIYFKKTSGAGSPGELQTLAAVGDYILWYSKDFNLKKFRPALISKIFGGEGADAYRLIHNEDGTTQSLGKKNIDDFSDDELSRICRIDNITSQTGVEKTRYPVSIEGQTFTPNKGVWKTSKEGMDRLLKACRVSKGNTALGYIRRLSDFAAIRLSNNWDDTTVSGASDKIYVVQTSEKVVQRCILMATDPGDLVLDPTCGSGTTASIAEQWGRRWITIDTSRVALALARSRIMGAKYPYYLLSDSPEGKIREAEVTRSAPNTQPSYRNIKHGFVYERVPRITLKSIANNSEIDVIWEKWQKDLESIREKLNTQLKKKWNDWEIPRETDSKWSSEVQKLHKAWWSNRIARQKEIDASISARAEFEYLYDKPFVDKSKVRVAGPFTVESVSPHKVFGINETNELIGEQNTTKELDESKDFVSAILENLKQSGVQQAHKDDKITFNEITPWPGQMICAEGKYIEAKSKKEKRAAILVGPEFGTVSRVDLVEAAKEAAEADFEVLVACAFNFDARATEFSSLGKIPVLKARMNADLHMTEDLKNTGKGNLFVIFGEPDIEIKELKEKLKVKINGVDVFHPNTGEVRSDGADGIACWMIDTDYNEESFFVRHAYFLGANDPYKSLKSSLKAEIEESAWESLNSDVSRPFDKPESGRIAVKVINHLGDEVMKVFKV